MAPGPTAGAKVKDGSLAAADFAKGQLPTGGNGAAGPQGPKGNTGKDATLGTMHRVEARGAMMVSNKSAEDAAKCTMVDWDAMEPGTTERSVGWSIISAVPATEGFKKTTDCTNGFGLIVPRDGVYTVNLNWMWQSSGEGDQLQAYVIQNSGFELTTVGDGRTSLAAQFVAP